MRPALLFLSLAACTGATAVVDDPAPVDTGASTDTASGTDTGEAPDTEPPPPPPTIRFVALGDAGTGDDGQFAVADVMEQVCADRGCDFALYLGDNLYNSGAESFDDPQFQSKFEVPYAHLDFPFYAVLGNHDLGGDGLGLSFDPNKAEYEIAYSAVSDKWDMPAEFYTLDAGKVPHEPARFFGLNTTDIFFGLGDPQEQWLEAQTAASDSTWNIAFGHHPYISNGQHGNAGEYEGISPDIPLTEIPRGQYVKEFVEETMCDGSIDVYFSGHDHNRQWLDQAPGCQTYFVVTGAGAKTTDFREADDNPTQFQDDTTEGFLWVEIAGPVLTAFFYDRHGDEAGSFVIEQPAP